MTKDKNYIKSLGNSIIDDLVNYSKDFFNIDITDILRRFDSSNKRKYSYGGIKVSLDSQYCVPYLDLSINAFLFESDEMYFGEYPEYSNDQYIGSYFGDWYKVLGVLISHEIAHCLDLHLKFHNEEIKFNENEFYDTEDSHHDKRFQYLYKVLRQYFLKNFETEDEIKRVQINKKYIMIQDGEIIGNGKVLNGKYELIKPFTLLKKCPEWFGYVVIKQKNTLKRVEVISSNVKEIS